jgi:hypothetical protein
LQRNGLGRHYYIRERDYFGVSQMGNKSNACNIAAAAERVCRGGNREEDQLMPQNMVVLLVIILVPIIPSYLLFKLLPASAAVNGPFKGLRIDLSGGFAGYFLIFLVLVGIRATFETTSYQKWAVSGQIVLPDDPARLYVDRRYVTLSDPSLRSDPDGNFAMSFLTTSDKQFDYPHMYINYPGYQPKAFWLGPKHQNDRNESLPITFDATHGLIDLGTIQLEKVSTPVVAAGGSVSTVNPYSGH